jgi:hypothetical protein
MIGENMNYFIIYENLISNAKLNPKIDTYKETHHILPKCMGGDDSKENLVMLTARQHYLAHWLLYKLSKNINEKEKVFEIGGQIVREGDVITLDGTTGEVFVGSIKLVEPE